MNFYVHLLVIDILYLCGHLPFLSLLRGTGFELKRRSAARSAMVWLKLRGAVTRSSRGLLQDGTNGVFQGEKHNKLIKLLRYPISHMK